MSLVLTKTQVLDRLKDKSFCLSKEELIHLIKETRTRTVEFQKLLIDGDVSGYEQDKSKGDTNPMLWEFGHNLFFWEHKAIRLLEGDDFADGLALPDTADVYDSFVVKADERAEMKLYSPNEILQCYNFMIECLIEKLEDEDYVLTPSDFYLFFISLLHNEMHNESYLFTQKMLGFPKPKVLVPKDKEYIDHPIYNKMVCIQGGSFVQGISTDKHHFTFDNEMPSFRTFVNDFYVSKYPVTESEFEDFLTNGGYDKEEYWCKPGWRWKTKNDISNPLYWEKVNDKWMVKGWGDEELRPTRQDLPMCHVSWYEACAYCKYIGARLPTESEWEYIATNGGKTNEDLYTLTKEDVKIKHNLDYIHGDIVSVDAYDDYENNKWEVSQLFGNVWEWCQEPIYPYDGFVIDPVYREMSYPFFGFKKICRGGCWAAPKILINPQYRNAQMPDNRIQFIGFRIVVDK